MTRLRRVLVAVVVLGVLGAFGGCSDDDPEPKVDDPTPSISSEPTESETVSTSPTVSPAMGPEETVRAWVDAWNVALRSGDTGPLKAYQAETCRNCDGLTSVIDDVVAQGGSFTGGDWSVASSKVVDASSTRAKVNVALNVAAGSTINAQGEEPVNYEADKRIATYELNRSTGQWLIDVIELLS